MASSSSAKSSSSRAIRSPVAQHLAQHLGLAARRLTVDRQVGPQRTICPLRLGSLHVHGEGDKTVFSASRESSPSRRRFGRSTGRGARSAESEIGQAATVTSGPSSSGVPSDKGGAPARRPGLRPPQSHSGAAAVEAILVRDLVEQAGRAGGRLVGGAASSGWNSSSKSASPPLPASPSSLSTPQVGTRAGAARPGTRRCRGRHAKMAFGRAAPQPGVPSLDRRRTLGVESLKGVVSTAVLSHRGR